MYCMKVFLITVIIKSNGINCYLVATYIMRREANVRFGLNLLYSTETYSQLSDPKYGLQIMSDKYLVENILAELH